MMDAREEMQDLKQNPLPQVVYPDPLTAVWECDRQIAECEATIAHYQEKRAEALTYALDNAIEEDSTCKLVAKKTTSTPNQVINTDKIKKDFPKVYERIWENKKSAVAADLEKFGKTVAENTVDLKISQKVAEPALKAEGHKLKDVLESGGPDVISYSYTVVRK